MNEVDLIIETDETPAEAKAMEDFARLILEKMELDNWQMGLVLTDDSGMRVYNREWRHKDAPTDVLSFVQDDGESIPNVPGMPKEAGDVVISLESVARNALQWEESYDREIRRVIIHGILHLNGMDHPEDDYGTGMLKIQEELLAQTGSLMKDNA